MIQIAVLTWFEANLLVSRNRLNQLVLDRAHHINRFGFFFFDLVSVGLVALVFIWGGILVGFSLEGVVFAFVF